VVLLEIRSEIYDHFHASPAGPAHFFLADNADAYAAYYTSMFLIQDTGEAIWTHMKSDFSPLPLTAYVEFWGIMQAVVIQQDAILQLCQAVVGKPAKIRTESCWTRVRDIRNLCAGHPSNRSHGVLGPQRTFLGRKFGNYREIRYELWDSSNGTTTHPHFDLRALIEGYDHEARDVLQSVLSEMRSRWPRKKAPAPPPVKLTIHFDGSPFDPI
jgi:hypothetical protein